mgnify:CR=1 FL=1
MKELKNLKELVETIHGLYTSYEDINLLIEMGYEDEDPAMVKAHIISITEKVATITNTKNITGPAAAINRVAFVTEQSVSPQTIFAKMISPTTVITNPIIHSVLIVSPSIYSPLIPVILSPAIPNNAQLKRRL